MCDSMNPALFFPPSKETLVITEDSTSSYLSPSSLCRFKELKNRAKSLAYEGQYQEAVNHFQKALRIYDSPKVRKYMKEVQSVMSGTEALESDSCNLLEIEEELATSEVFLEQGSSVSGCNPTNTIHGRLDDTERTNIKKSTSSGEKTSSYGESSESELNIQKLARVKEAYEEGRRLAEDGQLEKALKLLQKAQSIHKTEKVRKRIEQIQKYMASEIKTEADTSRIEVAEGFSVHQAIYNKLYPYQREGLRWLWKLFSNRKGGVLADDMGLGKTFQVIAFLSGLIDAKLVKHVLIIMPVTLIPTWQNEFEKWCPRIVVNCYHGTSVTDRDRNLRRAQRAGHVLLTTYGLVLSKVDALTRLDGKTFVWDYLILDEGHKIKNLSKTTKAIFEIPSRMRLVLTATPIQNNLREMWSLFDFALQGTLLGSSRTFKMQYEAPISRAREKDATAGEKRLGNVMSANLKSLIQPYLLRRVKDDAWKRQLEQVEQRADKFKITSLKKNDLILWVYLSDVQLEIYREFLRSDAVKSILLTKKSPLVQLTVLKKICDHPRLLSERACLQLGLHGELQAEELMKKIEDETTVAPSIQDVEDEELLDESGKLKLVVPLLENLKSSGHRTLVFSMSKRVLDMLYRILTNRHWKVIRIDGKCPLSEREKRIEKFQTDPSYPVFLLTTQVGGVGLTLTAADRVIIYDPSWNPATDAQAVDRAFRIGQEKNVVVYRLITCGTVEEKIYRRQVFKDSITRQTTGDADPFRYFSQQELRELFKFDNPRYSETQVQLSELHQRSSDETLDRHTEFLKSLGIFGISDHDLMFTGNLHDDPEDHDQNAVSEHFIKQRVAAAQNMIKSEASITAYGNRQTNTYCRPYQEEIPLPRKTPKANIVPVHEPTMSYEMIDLIDDDPTDAYKPLPQKRHFSSVKDAVYEDEEIEAAIAHIYQPPASSARIDLIDDYLTDAYKPSPQNLFFSSVTDQVDENKEDKAPMVPVYQPPTSCEMIDLIDDDDDLTDAYKPSPQNLFFSSVTDQVDENKENKGDNIDLDLTQRYSSKNHNQSLSEEIVVDTSGGNLSDVMLWPSYPTGKSPISSATCSNDSSVPKVTENMREEDKQLSRLELDLDISRQSMGRKRPLSVRSVGPQKVPKLDSSFLVETIELS